jgi:hypothetical protein
MIMPERLVNETEIEIVSVSGLICLGAGLFGFKYAFIGAAAAALVLTVAAGERMCSQDAYHSA